MRVYTPNCNAEVIGTAFIVNVSPKEKNITWLGVLEGRVAVIAKQHPLKKFKVERVFVYVSSGQKIETRPYSYPTPPELFSEGEWRMMQELYQLTDAEKIILLVGAGYDRVEELFRPAPLYVPQASRALPSRMRDMVDIIRKATEEGDITTVEKLTKTVEGFVEEHHNSEYDVEVLMFIASHYRYIKDYKNAIRVFEEVVKSYPNSHLTSLAQCAVATIYKDDLKDAQKAQEAYQQLISRYPGSIDAVRARDTLATIR
jgi:tetratricopeptide (TPR) repeat protein